MTVGELIRELQKSDQEAVVVIAQQHIVDGQIINIDIVILSFSVTLNYVTLMGC